MDRKIIFYAPLGKDIPPDKIGGAEAGCLKTKAIYERDGIKVIVLDKPALSRGRIRFIIGMALTPLKLLQTCIRAGKNTPVHIVGFYTKIVRFEWLLMKIAHYCGNKVVYELRNGSMVSTYEEGDSVYRKYLKALLLQPEVVLCQGQEYVDFIRKNWGVERSYYPNYIMDDFLVPNCLERGEQVRLIYFGRVTASKNVDVTIKVLSLLRKKNIDAVLDVIGGYSNEYKDYLDDTAKREGVENFIKFYGRRPFSFIAEHLRQSHYFLFPSTEKQEGHSNSLTEAMGCGVVPVASSAGFNVSICGNEDLIVNGINPQDYADRIIAIEKDRKWIFYSEFVYKRVSGNYTESIVGRNLLSVIGELYE